MDFFPVHLPNIISIDWFTPISTTYALIVVAEMGDKSQLVCMTLAARHRAKPVILGAIAAFALLNTLAVLFGVAIASWMPDYIVAALVSVLFAFFGLQSLFFNDNEQGSEIQEKSGHNLFLTTFLLITVAEFGDKTQLAIIALSSTAMPLAIWIGATLALATTSILGVIAGRTLLKKIPLTLLHYLSGLFFLILAGIAAYHAYLDFNTRFAAGR
jgi:putative Ca2+/H+ antiporter (TMEM165/GDT1 family)